MDLPAPAYAAALASVPGIGPKALRVLLEDQGPAEAWAGLVRGRPFPGIARWPAAVRAARGMDVAAIWSAHVRAGIGVTVLGDAGYPAALADDPEAPAVLFALGDPSVSDDRPRVALVGTRSATRYGLGVAAQLGADLAATGVVVVSGLALGIDGAAHEGALAAWRAAEAPDPTGGAHPHGGGPVRVAPPVAVVAGGLDAPYPRQHAGLWRRVAGAGAVLSEAPLGSADLGWRFPQRNRIMAAMADVVVVVECHPSGGSMHTVQAAARRGVPVGAVPGSVRSPASGGTNALLADGCFVVRDASDVLVAVGLATESSRAPGRGASPRRPSSSSGPGEVAVATGRTGGAVAAARASEAAAAPSHRSGALGPPDPGPASRAASGSEAVLDALGWERCSVEQLLRRTGLELHALSIVLEHLRAEGVVHGTGDAWERVAPDPPGWTTEGSRPPNVGRP